MRTIHSVILYVADLQAAISFYRDVLELDLRFAEHGYAEFATGAARLGLYERARLPDLIGEEAAARDPQGEILFLVDDLDAEIERLRNEGARVLSGPVDRPWGQRTAHVGDAEGHVIELAQEIPRTRPRGA